MTPYEQIDFVFFYLKEKIQYGGSYGYQNILNRVIATPEANIKVTLLNEILLRLEQDGFITKSIIPNAQPVYQITFKGLLFDGYTKSHQALNEKERFENYVQSQNIKNGKYLNRLTLILAIVTGIAAVYYILEILNHWFCIYPRK